MSSSYELLCYTREATSREEANNEDIAYSMHLALRADGATEWEPLNENYGVFFAAGVPIQAASSESRRACVAAAHFVADPFDEARPAADAVAYGAVMPGIDITLKSLKDPYLFRLADGRFALAATRTARGGAPDGSERSAFLLALSDDLTAFTQLGLVMLRTGGGVNRPSVAFDADASRYVISWISDDGDARSASVADIVAAAESGEPLDVAEAAVSAKSCHFGDLSGDCDIPNAVPGNVIDITEEEAAKLIERFGRIYNVGTSVATQHIDAAISGEAAREAVQALAKVRADLVYSDGSGATRAVDWNKDELEAIAQDAAEGKLQPGDTRTVSGRIRQTVYPVPFAVERADPSVFAWNFNGKPMFMFIATDDTDGNCVDPNDGATHMPLRIADSIEALSDAAGGRAKEIDLLKCGDYNAEGRAMTGSSGRRNCMSSMENCRCSSCHASMGRPPIQTVRPTIARASQTCGRAAAISCSSSSIPTARISIRANPKTGWCRS